jgi:hypothetical protein
MACYYQDDMGKLPVTQLFTLKGDAIGDSYPIWGYDGIVEWEKQFAQGPADVHFTSSYTEKNIIGQFAKFAEAHGDSHSNCWVTTSKDHALAWFAKISREGKLDTARIQDWRPTKAGVLAVEDWSGRPSANAAAEAEPEPEADRLSSSRSEETASGNAPTRHKMTNAEADAKFAADKAEYEKKLAEQQKQVDDFKRAQDEVARKKQEQKLAADRAAADYQRQLDAHARTVRNQQLDYQKEIAKPTGVANAVYRGFWGPDCDAARRSATLGGGTSTTTRFKEVVADSGTSGCTVGGWWWNVAGGGTATRQ